MGGDIRHRDKPRIGDPSNLYAVDTIKELFEGNEPLFRGLAVHHAWDWSAAKPVVRLSFGRGELQDAGFRGRDGAAARSGAERRRTVAALRSSHRLEARNAA